MTIHLEEEIVGSRFDPVTRTCHYTIARNGKRWTVAVPIDHLEAHKANKAARRNHLANVLQNAMNGPHDPPSGTKTDPHQPATWQDFDKVPDGHWFINPADGKLTQKS